MSPKLSKTHAALTRTRRRGALLAEAPQNAVVPAFAWFWKPAIGLRLTGPGVYCAASSTTRLAGLRLHERVAKTQEAVDVYLRHPGTKMKYQITTAVSLSAVLPNCTAWARSQSLGSAAACRRLHAASNSHLRAFRGGSNRSQGPYMSHATASLAQAQARSIPARWRHVDPVPSEAVFREPVPLELKRALVVAKTTRYEDEARIHKGKGIPELTSEDMNEVDKVLQLQGFSVDALKHSHESQTNSLDMIIQALQEKGIDFDITTSGESFTGVHGGGGAARHGEYDLVISAGGDGTFLRAALDNDGSTPQVGINTDPSRSRGQLCADFAHNLPRQLDKLRAGAYTWVKRSRIRARMVDVEGGQPGTLEQFALNEVFVGERDPVRASVLKVRADEEEWEKHKCSGLLISTGTGTSAWAAEAAKVNPQDVMAVLRGLEAVYQGMRLEDVLTGGLDAGAVASAANQATAAEGLVADADELQLLVREPILAAGAIDRGICIWQGAKPSKARLLGDGEIFSEYHPMRSIARRIKVSSVGCDVNLVLDGRSWVGLERGVEVEFQVADKNPLWTFRFD